MNYVQHVKRHLNGHERISFDYDGVLNTINGRALIKRAITEGYNVFIISARNERNRKPVEEFAKEISLNINRIYTVGSNKAKIEKIKELQITKHYDNNKDVIDALKETTTKGILTNY